MYIPMSYIWGRFPIVITYILSILFICMYVVDIKINVHNLFANKS